MTSARRGLINGHGLRRLNVGPDSAQEGTFEIAAWVVDNRNIGMYAMK
jgi:hypothetical protein